MPVPSRNLAVLIQLVTTLCVSTCTINIELALRSIPYVLLTHTHTYELEEKGWKEKKKKKKSPTSFPVRAKTI